MSSTTAPSVSTTASLRRRSLGILAAVAACVAIWLVGAFGGADYAVRSPGQAVMVVNLVPVVVVSLAAALLGWAALALLERFTGRSATTIWFSLVVAATLLSFAPLLQVDATAGAKIALGAMHLTVPVVLVSQLPENDH
ncbi:MULTISPECIES: DUF6069 family protein [Micromonospora]|uniref:Uncharacterized protein n=1 Tax=Micromonospora maris TaxID=1003110 RepID=A0A9X0I0M1_9ACTN|nr:MULTISPECIES: DUF6069 family protein [Micromonospora]AEB45202.1 hypothetical protein VAB18032_20510 [Micromonospora maris AB-18-032]KUJ44609.1 hypothetical protein ADL17_15710 [Micromonospora maris]RUL90584.1 hypothetical protein EG812_24725 [Verrucosispora sp. FIM060022]